MNIGSRSLSRITLAATGSVGLTILAMAAGCSGAAPDESTAALPAETSALTSAVAYRRPVTHEGRAYTFTKTITAQGQLERTVTRPDGSALSAEEERGLERALWERTRAPRVAPELRAAAEAGEAREVVLYGDEDAGEAARVVRELELDADAVGSGPLPGTVRLHADAGRLAALVRAVDEGRLAGLDAPHAIHPKGPTIVSDPYPAEQMTWTGQNAAVTFAHFPEDGLPPGAPPPAKGIIGVYYECPRLTFPSLTATYNPRGLNCGSWQHGDAITNLIDHYITIPGRGPFTNQIAYEQFNDLQDIGNAVSWFQANVGAGQLSIVNASNSQYDDGSAAPTINANDRLVDRLIAQNKAIWVQATGDLRGAAGSGDYVHHLGWNSIKTAWAERYTDGTFFFNGSVKNPPTPHGDRELPEVIAPGYAGLPSEAPGSTGSSAAVPQIVGIVAAMQSRDDNLKVSPASVRALLMMSAWKQPGAIKWASALGNTDLADGAGMVSAPDAVLGAMGAKRPYQITNKTFQADNLTGYYNDTLTTDPCTDPLGCSVDRNRPVTITFPAGSDHIKLALAWSIADAFNDDPSQWLDLDLALVDDHGVSVASSMSYDNNYEIVDAQVDPSRSYTLHIFNWSNRYGTQEYAVAWSRHVRAIYPSSNDVLSGWPASNAADGDPSTVYSSNWFASSANDRNSWLVVDTSGQPTVEGVVLYPRFVNGVVTGFPTSFQLFMLSADYTAWVPEGSYDTSTDAFKPQPDGSVVIALAGGPIATHGVKILPTGIGQDDWGNHFFQMADVSFK